MVDTTGTGGWGVTPFGLPSQSTQQLSPSQVSQIRQQTTQMGWPTTQPAQQPTQQQSDMMKSLMNFGGQNGPGGAASVPNYGQTSNAVGLGAGTGGLSFPMFGP